MHCLCDWGSRASFHLGTDFLCVYICIYTQTYIIMYIYLSTLSIFLSIGMVSYGILTEPNVGGCAFTRNLYVPEHKQEGIPSSTCKSGSDMQGTFFAYDPSFLTQL